MKRAFLVLLLLFALLASTAIQHTLNSTPYTTGKMLGVVPLTDMVFALPAGIFAAGLIGIMLSIGAEFWRALLPICGADWVPTRKLSALADTGLWCGWITVGTCYAALPCIFPWIAMNGADSLYTVESYRTLLFIGIGIMIAARLFNTFLPRRQGLWATLMSAAVGLGAGQFWWNGLPVDLLALALLLPISVILCSLTRREGTNTPFTWLGILALALSLYATGFSQLIISYPTGPIEQSEGWLTLKFVANTLLVFPLIILLTPVLRHHRYIQGAAGACGILSVLLYNWYAIASPLDAALIGTLPTTPATVVYVVALLCLVGLGTLRLFCHRKSKENQ